MSTFLTTGLQPGRQFRLGLQPAGLQQSAITTDDMVMLIRASVASVLIGISPRRCCLVFVEGRVDDSADHAGTAELSRLFLYPT